MSAETDPGPGRAECAQDPGAAGHLLTIINDILDFSRIEAGRLNLESTSFGLPELLEEVCELMSSQAEAKGLELLLDLDLNASRCFIGDPTRVKQVLINLLGNAVRFSATWCDHSRMSCRGHGRRERTSAPLGQGRGNRYPA